MNSINIPVRAYNTQRIEKSWQDEDGTLDVHSVFYTIQGEGPLTGHPAIFVRLAGCNLQCPDCDTEYTRGRTLYSPSALMNAVRALHPGPRLVVITGGEPFRQNITPFVDELVDEGYAVQIETNGTLPVPFALSGAVWIVCSPKAGKVHATVEDSAVAYKYVMSADSVDKEDGLPVLALHHSAHPRVARPPARLMDWRSSERNPFPRGAVYLQPADHKDPTLNGRNLKACIASCMKHGYTLQLQTHKLIGME